jgi:short-subunit dehydrogenase
MQRIFIIGATSAMAEGVARLYASEGCRLFLTGRRADRLHAIATDLSVRGAVDTQTCLFDVNDIGAHADAIDQAWKALGGFDVVLVAHGTLPDQAACERSVEETLREFTTNASSTIALLTELSARMEPARQGTIAVISSVAGDRGRASNYVYGAAKAAVSTYLSGLRQRLTSAGINVLTIKPGFVDTPMTATFKKGPLWASVDTVASAIVRAIQQRKSVAYVPRFWWWIMYVVKAVPEAVFRRVRL